MVESWKTAIPTLDNTQDRLVYVYLPQDYFISHLCYPVLYLFDGQTLFSHPDNPSGKDIELNTFLDAVRCPLIIVAVSSATSADARLAEYAPFAFSHKRFGTHSGKGMVLMDWYVNTLKPIIDSQYRTLPQREHTYILGCSMGGLMSLYALIAYNQTFHGAAALSPSLWAAPEQMLNLCRTAPLNRDTILYLDFGQKELSPYNGMLQTLQQFSDTLQNRQILLTQRIVPGGSHSSKSWKRQLPLALTALLYSEPHCAASFLAAM